MRTERRRIARASARRGSWAWRDRADMLAVQPALKGWGRCSRAVVNDIYSVLVYHRTATQWGDVVHLAIRRHDNQSNIPWADKQRIKDEVCGPERVGIEVYPARSDLINCANMFHLWIMPEGFALPFGI